MAIIFSLSHNRPKCRGNIAVSFRRPETKTIASLASATFTGHKFILMKRMNGHEKYSGDSCLIARLKFEDANHRADAQGRHTGWRIKMHRQPPERNSTQRNPPATLVFC